MEKIEIRKARHGWIISYWKDHRQVEEVYTTAESLGVRIYDLSREMAEC